MTGAATLVGLALDGLRRKAGRNALTASGVFVGVLALTMIVALGQGIEQVIRGTVADEENLRQVGLAPGYGYRLEDDPDIEVEGAMSEARRERLRRAARARARPGTFAARRAQSMTPEDLERVRGMEHVETVFPIVVERYRLTAGEHEAPASAVIGVDVSRDRYADRVIAGRYLGGPEADEALVHEYLAYEWGYVTPEALRSLVGRTLVLESLDTGADVEIGALAPDALGDVLRNLPLDALDDTERAELRRLAGKLLRAWRGGGNGAGDAAGVRRPLEIVGIVRELEPRDRFNVIEDGNARQTDVFVPFETARELYFASPVNRELGYRRAVVMVDEPGHAAGVEQALRDEGWSAFSVGSILDRIQSTVALFTLIVAFLTGIALLVASLGIVNTMVTSVVERTSEIGLWKAVGATNAQIRTVFLVEAGLIGLVGGLLGLGAALLLMIPGEAIADRVIAEEAIFPIVDDVFFVPWWLPVAGVGLAVAVAMLASLYPARHASRIDPVRALRHD